MRHYSTLKRIAKDHQPNPAPCTGYVGWWIYGDSGVGKTTTIVNKFGYDNIYFKDLTKWWDGFKEGMIVLCDDFDVFHRDMGSEMKQWGHRYPFRCQDKGGYLTIRPHIVIITSQYRIGDIWDDDKTREAISNRFVEIKKESLDHDISEQIFDRNLIDVI